VKQAASGGLPSSGRELAFQRLHIGWHSPRIFTFGRLLRAEPGSLWRATRL